ncbi:MAG: hypothetical protein Ta2F_18430 [Termitinemataceae bacterium]|nr:MAG: hypothetical protein Ta2F_18430 [Termitinemataceae bacterium]
MGQGNPESADAIFARHSDVFVADKLSDQNKKQAERLKVNGVEFHSKNGYTLKKALAVLSIPHKDFTGNLDEKINEIFLELFVE